VSVTEPATPTTTVVVVPRESHSHTEATVRRLIATTPAPLRLLVVDGGSPRRVHRRLLELAREHDFTLIRRDALVTPPEARNLALDHVNTELVALVDNDTLVDTGWLESLERCLRETGAAIVMPVVLEQSNGRQKVHYAGGDCHVAVDDGHRRLVDFNPYIGKGLAVLDELGRRPTENVELHCALARTDAVRAVGEFDERVIGVRDDSDFALRLHEHGHESWIEPTTRVVYPYPKRFRFGDRAYFLTRWSDAWSEPGFRHFNSKWELDDDSLDDVFRQGHMERRIRSSRWPRPAGGWRLRVWRARRRLARAIDRVMTPLMVSRATRPRRTAPEARVVHSANWDRVS
jgi:GT2 family glycosyltransferase